MTPKKLISAFAAASALLLFTGSAQAVDATNSMDAASVKSVYSHGAKADYLAGYHMREKAAGCSTCHPGDKVSDSQTEIDKKCASCHGSYDSLGKKDLAGGMKISAHAGHLSIDSCTTCHGGHEASFAYCNNCHIFDMPMKFGRQKIAYTPVDLSIYRDAVPNRTEKADFVVIGAGGAGIAAAIDASNKGLKTIVIEKMPIIGGSSLLSTGGMNVAGSAQQKAAGVNDTPAKFVEDTLKVGKGANDKVLVKVLAEQSNSALEWFEALGGKLDLDPGVYGGCQAPRMHYTKSGGIGRYMIKVMKPALEKSGADVRVNSQAVRLERDKDGAVTGVLVKGKNTGLYRISAPTVLLSTGSYANNGQLVSKYHPEFFGMVTSAQPGSHGDGIYLGEAVGAKVTHLERVQVHPNIASGTSLMITLAMRTNGGILVNNKGQRFYNDNAPRNELGAAMLKQPAQKVWLIYDDAVVAKRPKVHEGYERLGLVTEAESPEALAEKLGIPAKGFADTMKRYAGFVEAKNDADFGRKELPEPLNHGKLYAIDVVPAVGGTLGGLRTDARTHVLDVNGKPIPGLLAAGEVVGEWHGKDRYGGNAVAGNIVFGRIAAQEAASAVGK
jgi:fumarate reductase flavoprotein subunit